MAATPVVVTTKMDERNGIADAVEHDQKFEVPEEVPGKELGRPLPTSTCAAQGANRRAVTLSSFFATGMPVANAHVACAQSPRVHTRVRIKWTYQDKSYSLVTLWPHTPRCAVSLLMYSAWIPAWHCIGCRKVLQSIHGVCKLGM